MNIARHMPSNDCRDISILVGPELILMFLDYNLNLHGLTGTLPSNGLANMCFKLHKSWSGWDKRLMDEIYEKYTV